MDILRQYLKGERGRLQKLAGALKLTPSAIIQWEKVPAERVVAVEDATGIARCALRPDIFTESTKRPARQRKGRAA